MYAYTVHAHIQVLSDIVRMSVDSQPRGGSYQQGPFAGAFRKFVRVCAWFIARMSIDSPLQNGSSQQGPFEGAFRKFVRVCM
jgi:hypothetical protein